MVWGMGDFLPMGAAVAGIMNESVVKPWCNAQRAPGCVVET